MDKIIFKIISILLVMMLFQGCIPSEPPPTPTQTYIPTQMPDELREKIVEADTNGMILSSN